MTFERFEAHFRIEDLERGVATDIARAIEDPFTIVRDLKDGEHYLAYDTERVDIEPCDTEVSDP